MYKNYHEIYAQYWPDPDEPLVECGKHTGTWDDEVAENTNGSINPLLL